MTSPAELADTLSLVEEHEYVRFTAHWMATADHLDEEPAFSGDEVVDALVSAAAALVGLRRDGVEPEWTTREGRGLRTRLWHPGHPRMFAYSLVRAPGSFIVRGVVVDADSLVSF